MAWKFKQEYVKDGDVVEPSEWRINVNESLSEINGFLDSDNIAEGAVENRHVRRGAFTEVFSSEVPSNRSFIFRHTQSGWQRTALSHFTQDRHQYGFVRPSEFRLAGLMLTAENADERMEGTAYPIDLKQNAQLPNVKFTPDSDGLLICEFNGWVQWNRYDTSDTYVNDDGTIDFTDYDFSHQYAFFAPQSSYFKQFGSMVLCSQWRITVNGQSVAESGPLGNEYAAHPIYLCGVTPILKNVETIVQLECQFIWYSLGRDKSIQASSFAPPFLQPYSETAEPAPVGPGAKKYHDSKTHTYRKDCSLQNPFLTCILRKR